MDAAYLTNKVILILTPQSWGKMLLAKHHYAIELAKRGNEVYFLNPPDNENWSWRGRKKRISIETLSNHSNLYIIHQQLFFPYRLKFHARALYNGLIKKQIRDILLTIPGKVDLVWSFDLGNLFPIEFFNKSTLKVFHPVDEPGDSNAILAAAGADILFSVTNEIIGKYKSFGIPAYFINHGLADEFTHSSNNRKIPDNQIHVGLSGNFQRPDLDRRILMQIILENPEVIFHFYGSYKNSHSNIGASSDQETKTFIDYLLRSGNVEMHGVLNTADLAKALNQMDALLICYDLKRDQSKGTNYHKVMEYLSTGKVIISNNITTYHNYPELIRMTDSRQNNDALPALFKETLDNLQKWNEGYLANLRSSFARDNTYKKQLDRIEGHIFDLIKRTRFEQNKNLIPEV